MKTKKSARSLKFYKTCCFVSFVLFSLGIASRMYFSNKLVVKNQDLKSLSEAKASLEKEVALLSFEDANLSSPQYIESQAGKLGFEDMKESLLSLDLNAPLPVAALSPK